MNYESYVLLKQTVDNAKKDLKSGISRNQLETMYKNKYILEKDYLEIKEAINKLEMIIYLYEPMIIEYEKENHINRE